METVEQAVAEVGRVLSYRSNIAAEKVADEAVARFPQSGDCWAMVALTKLWRGQLEEAQAAIETADEVEPDSLVATVIAGEIECYLGNKEEGMRLIDEARQAIPDHWTVLRQAGSYSLAGKPETARQMIDRRLELDPENPAALNSLVTFYQTSHDHSALDNFLDNAPESYRSNCGYFRAQANRAIHRRDTVSAEEYLRAAVAADSDSSLAWGVLACLLANSNRLEEAEQAAGYALELNSRTPMAFRALAIVARARGDKAKQADYEAKVKTSVPGLTGNTHHRLATELRRQRTAKERIKFLSQEPSDELPMHRGLRLRLLASALRTAKEFETLGPVLEALEGLGAFTEEYFGAKAALMVDQNEAERALSTIDEGLLRLPGSISLMADKVKVLHGAGQLDEATTLAKHIAGLPVPSALSAMHTVDILASLKYVEEAKAVLTRAERETPARGLRVVRLALDLQERPELRKQLADRAKARMGPFQRYVLLPLVKVITKKRR